MLGEQIKRCREKRGFTQEQLAEKIGVSIETISSIERGIKMPRLQNFVAIANQLGVSADELLQDELDSVSYTHLRAHETRHDLVCRLLLEKKKNT